MKSPSKLAPTRNYDGAERRAQIVLAAMSDAGFVTDDAAKAAIASAPKIVKQSAGGSINYVADWVMDVLDGVVGRVEQDIVVETTIDPALQAQAEKALLDELDAEGREVRRRAGRDGGDDAAGRGARAGRRRATTPKASSTARSRRSASRARRSSRSSISPRWSAG